MTENIVTADEPQDAAGATNSDEATLATEPLDDDATDAETAADDDPVAKVRREAAKHRRRAREVESERDTIASERDQLRQRVDTMLRAEVERIAGDDHPVGSVALARPADLWLADTSLEELLDDAGVVDESKVRAKVSAVVAERPHWSRTSRAHDVTRYVGGAAAGRRTGGTWSDVLRGG